MIVDIGEGILDCLVVALMRLFALLDLVCDFIESFAHFAHREYVSLALFGCLAGGWWCRRCRFVIVVVVVVIVVDDFATLRRRECSFVFFHCVVEEFASVDIQGPERFLFLGCGGGFGGGFGGHLHRLDHFAMSLRQFHVFPNLAMKLRWKHIFVAQMAPGFQKHAIHKL